MSAYRYVIQDASGKTLRGVIDAPDRSVLLELFRERKWRVLSIDTASQMDVLIQRFMDQISGVRRENVIFFTRQLYTLVHSGLPLVQALESLAYQERNSKFKNVIEHIKAEIERGKTLKDTLKAYPHLFSQLYVGMIEAGEAAGILDQVLERLARMGMQELEIRSKLQSAMTYPVILVGVAIFVVAFLLIGAVPKFLDIFKASNAELPLATLILLHVSSFLREFWFLILAVLALGVYVLERYYHTPQGKLFFDRWLLKTPVVGDLYLKVMIARFTRAVSGLTKSGIPLLRALEITKSIITHSTISKSLDEIRSGISQGKNLTELFQKAGIFPPMVVQMISVGESTGKLDEMLQEVAEFYESELDYFLRNMSSTLEPVLLLFMGVMVGFIALAVLMPVFNLVKVFKQ